MLSYRTCFQSGVLCLSSWGPISIPKSSSHLFCNPKGLFWVDFRGKSGEAACNSPCVCYLQIYPVMEKEGRTRLALIICNKVFDYLSDREGSENDILGMQGLLENLGYLVVIKENLTALVIAQDSGISFLPSLSILDFFLHSWKKQCMLQEFSFSRIGIPGFQPLPMHIFRAKIYRVVFH